MPHATVPPADALRLAVAIHRYALSLEQKRHAATLRAQADGLEELAKDGHRAYERATRGVAALVASVAGARGVSVVLDDEGQYPLGTVLDATGAPVVVPEVSSKVAD